MNQKRDLSDTFENIQENCRLSDVVRGSSEDFDYLFGTTTPVEIYDKHIRPLCHNFICTQDAGDNFNAGFGQHSRICMGRYPVHRRALFKELLSEH